MGDYGIKITRDGYGVDTTEPRNYVLNSAHASAVKIQQQYTGTLTVNAGGTTQLSIEHGLSFIPMFIFYTEPSPSSGKWFFGIIYNFGGGDPDAGDCDVDSYADGNGDIVGTYVDETYIKLQITNFGVSQRIVKYRVIAFGETGA